MVNSSEIVKDWVKQEGKVSKAFNINDQKVWDRLNFYSQNFKDTFIQTEHALAWLCLVLDSDRRNRDALVSRLTSVSVLLFTCRDHLAFQRVHESGLYARISEEKQLRQLPTVVQLQAIIQALKPGWVDLTEDELGALKTVETLTDKALKIENLKAFRDQVVLQGVLLEKPKKAGPFPAESYKLPDLVKEAGQCWSVLSKTLADQ